MADREWHPIDFAPEGLAAPTVGNPEPWGRLGGPVFPCRFARESGTGHAVCVHHKGPGGLEEEGPCWCPFCGTGMDAKDEKADCQSFEPSRHYTGTVAETRAALTGRGKRR